MTRRVLGKSIEAIISNKSTVESSNKILDVHVDLIYPNPHQPRKRFDKEKIEELAKSINESGLIQPIVVFEDNGKYFIVVGERRWRSVQLLKWEKIPAVVRKFPKDEILVQALVENIQRENLNAIEIAYGIDELLRLEKITQEKASQKLGMSRSSLTNFLRLLSLPEEVQKSIISNEISPGHARALLSLESNDRIISLFNKIIQNKLSVRQTEQLAKKVKETKPEKKTTDPNIDKIEEKLCKHFLSKVKLNFSRKGTGKIEIFFSQLSEFQRILNLFFKEKE